MKLTTAGRVQWSQRAVSRNKRSPKGWIEPTTTDSSTRPERPGGRTFLCSLLSGFLWSEFLYFSLSPSFDGSKSCSKRWEMKFFVLSVSVLSEIWLFSCLCKKLINFFHISLNCPSEKPRIKRKHFFWNRKINFVFESRNCMIVVVWFKILYHLLRGFSNNTWRAFLKVWFHCFWT